VDADGRQRLAHLVKLEGFDDRDDEFHGQAFISLDISWARGSMTAWSNAADANLASFCANGTKKLQEEEENITGW